MLRIDLANAREGMSLALPVQNPEIPARTLLKAGFTLSPSIINKLTAVGVKQLWVRYPALDFLDKFIDNTRLQTHHHLVTSITDTFERLQTQAAAKMNYDTYLSSVASLVDSIISNPTTSLYLGKLCDSNDALMQHASSTTYLACLMAIKLEGYLVKQRKHVNPARAKEFTNLGLGTMLHDIGITQLAADVRNAYDYTEDETDPAWQEHPALGFRMVRGKVDPSAATVVLNHHQRFDGSGYAGADFPQLSGNNIHVFARIAAVAEQFDRLKNPNRMPEQPTVFVLRAMTSLPLSEKFDPQVLTALLDVVPPYAPGSIVKLSDDRHAVVIDHNKHDPCRPMIQIIPDPEEIAGSESVPAGPQIDLSQSTRGLYVTFAENHDVADLNFSKPTLAGVHSLAEANW
ncbi:HD-GYP domain-containing protein [Poriferisphaera sp. WC338]|uniref:HD-GYP domain-containing protein n=1 Tax=Poriferisphaera sp. WC338 TaxID=3425129 RepID=UPI003D819F89